MPDHLKRGIALFNAQDYFAAHEELEDAWRLASGEAKLFLQAVTQAAVALHHQSTGNIVGAKSVLERALANLSEYPVTYLGINVEALKRDLKKFLDKISGPEVSPKISYSANENRIVPGSSHEEE